MSLPAISVRQLGKMYRLNHQAKRTDSFRDAITSVVTSPWRRFKQLRGMDADMEEFWALRNISFDIQPGEVVGIIGRNGAGKSTLLKILSRIVEPTEGEIHLRGRVASLLEVGTGFHPELTGRENIYLNGSILGMRKREIDAKFDEIVAFSEVEKFLDTPVKRYSSGMYVRLAFSVAAHLDPEILIVDEVLAVGDAAFQQKCLGKMKEASQRVGRTVLFVSHNMATVKLLCSRAIVLGKGRVEIDSTPWEAVDAYISTSSSDPASQSGTPGCSQFNLSTGEKLSSVLSSSAGGTPTDQFMTGAPQYLRFETTKPLAFPIFVLTINSINSGNAIVSLDSGRGIGLPPSEASRVSSVLCEIPELLLAPGSYKVDITIWHDTEKGRTTEFIEGAFMFHVQLGPIRGRIHVFRKNLGESAIPHTWGKGE